MLEYLKSKEFRYTILGLVVFGIVSFVLFFFVFLPSYTQHGESVLVPELTKLTLEEVENALDEMDLEYEISDSVFLAGSAPLTVISQDPSPQSKVKPGRKIYLTVNKVIPPLVKFPNVIHVSNYQAKLRLDSWGFAIKDVRYVESELRNVVLKVELDGKEVKVGQLLPSGTRVLLVIGKGLGSQYASIPDLVGLPYQEAVSLLQEAGFNIGSLRFKPDAGGDPGLIFQQRPPYIEGDSINVGESFDLFISGSEPQEAIEVPIE